MKCRKCGLDFNPFPKFDDDICPECYDEELEKEKQDEDFEKE
jgi:hypothetical protein